MSFGLESIAFTNLITSPTYNNNNNNNRPSSSSSSSSSSSMPPLCRRAPLGLQVLRRPNKKMQTHLSIPRHKTLHNRLPSSSKSSDIHIDKEKDDDDDDDDTHDSQEAWHQALQSFKQQALTTYLLYSQKAIIFLKETSHNLKIHATQEDFTLLGYFATAADNSPEQLKDIVQTFASSTADLNHVSKVRDFYVGIPYGGLLSVGGFFSFMLTGSIPAIRFGIILGGTLLALSISSLRLWKKGEFSPLILKAQTAIATILFLRELNLLPMQRPFIVNFVSLLVSGGVVTFYLYRIIGDEAPSGPSLEVGPENQTS